MYRRKFASAFGAGSVAVTLRPRARYSAAQLAPMTPVPTIATFRISFFFAIPSSLDCFNSQKKLFESFHLLFACKYRFGAYFRYWLHKFFTMVIHDEPVTPLPRHVGPSPLQEDAQTEARCGQELQVHRRPGEPGPKPTDLDFPALQHSETLADYGHGALVKVAEGSRRGIPNYAAVNQLSRVTPSLHRHLRNPWQRFAVLIEGGGVADDEDLGVSGHGEIFLNAYAPRAIRFDVQPLARRRGGNSRGPDNCLARDPFAGDHDPVRVDVIDAMSEPDFNSQLLESLLGGFGKGLRKRPQNTGSHIDEHNSRGGRVDPSEV